MPWPIQVATGLFACEETERGVFHPSKKQALVYAGALEGKIDMDRMRSSAGCFVLLALALIACGGSDPDGVDGVNALLDRIEKAHGRRDAATLIDQCADEELVAITVVGPEDARRAHVMNRGDMTKEAFGRMWQRAGLTSRRKTDRDILMAAGDLAFLTATTVDTLKGGRTVKHRDFYIARRKGQTWRICFSMPQIMRPTLAVLAVADGSAAARAGLRAGDEVTALNGIGTDKLTSTKEINALLAPGENKKALLLTVRRGGRELRITVPGDLGGASIGPRLMPLPPAVLVGPGKDHGAKQVLRREHKIIAGGRIEDFESLCHPKAFFQFPTGPDGATRFTSLAEGTKEIADGVAKFRKLVDVSKARIDPILAIADENVAIVSGVFHFTVRDTGKAVVGPTRTQVYVRQGEKWLVAAVLEHRIRYGLDPLESAGK